MDDKTKRRLLAFLEANPGAQRADFAGVLADLGRKDSSTLWRWLSDLKKEGLVSSEGSLKGTRYFAQVPSSRERDIGLAVADVVRFGHTIALDHLTREQGRDRLLEIVQRALSQLTPADLPRYGLSEREFNDFNQSRTPFCVQFVDQFAPSYDFAREQDVELDSPSVRG